jgi:hypothetical protein
MFKIMATCTDDDRHHFQIGQFPNSFEVAAFDEEVGGLADIRSMRLVVVLYECVVVRVLDPSDELEVGLWINLTLLEKLMLVK